MDFIQEYLKWQDYGNTPANRNEKQWEPRYQLLRWEPSALVAGFQTVTIATEKSNNVLFIRIVEMIISTDGLGGTIVFNDARIAKPLFSIDNSNVYFSQGCFNYLVNDKQFTMISTSATVQFSLGFITISKDRLKV